MADELKTTLGLSYTNGSDTLSESVSDSTDVATTPKVAGAVENFGTGGANFSKGPIGNYGVTFVENLGANYVELSWDGGTNYFAQVLPGEWQKVRPPAAGATNLWIRANTAAVDCKITAFSPAV